MSRRSVQNRAVSASRSSSVRPCWTPPEPDGRRAAPRPWRPLDGAPGARLPRAAQETGQVREDRTADELFDLLSGAAGVRENAGPDRDSSPRFVRLVLEGIIVRPAGD
ncbi:hypothetical protein ACIQM3_19880 [Streptomyces sp. NPDC091271]|uniref:SbtR family transcriptional regulator n=1 Tax=Streptomyces sp. NPDC091271 TaxID=3365980 RepID=UPI0038277E39